MIRGAVEQVQGSRVSGWIYSAAVDLRGATLLAFVEDACVGAGKVDILRQDLADAGLGDGRFGYSFPVTLAHPSDGTRVVVKLEGSDAMLKQASSRILGVAAQAPKPPPGTLGLPLASLHWMQRRGWLNQSEFDFLRFFAQLGVYDRSLSVPDEKPDRVEVELTDPAVAASDLLELIHIGTVEAVRVTLPSAGDIPGALKNIAGATSIVAIWSRERARLDVVEGSHTNPLTQDDSAPTKPPVDYALGPDRLLFLDARCVFGQTATPPSSGIDVFVFAEG
jgi:hypothetical protein